MQLLKVKGGFAVLSKITGFQLKRNQLNKGIAPNDYHEFQIVAEVEDGVKYTLAEPFIAQDEDFKKN